MLTLVLAMMLGAGNDSFPVLFARRATPPLRIDGILEPVWHGADSAKGFIQRYPHEGLPATDSTTVYVLFDDACLYVAFQCYARPDQLNLQVVPRDEVEGDYVGLMLDTFDDRNTAYCFAVNAQGVEFDGRVSGDNGTYPDASWNGVWFSAARVFDWGYCVELKIPFKAIRYKPDLTEWGVNFTRHSPRNGESDDWSPQKYNQLRVSRSGHLTGIEPRSSGINLELYPVGLLRYDALGTPRFGPDAGLDIAWFPGPSASLQLTANPDFAQIEADPTQINLTRYELQLSERRPFFTEGSEFFNINQKVFYSRRIGRPLPDGTLVPILGGIKFTSRDERFQFGGMAVVCKETPWNFDSLKTAQDTEPTSYFGVGRFRYNITSRIYTGLLYASKDNRSLHNRALALGGGWRTQELSLSVSLAGADYLDPTDSARGLAGSASAYWENNQFYAGADFSHTPRRFIVRGMGFAPTRITAGDAYGGLMLRNWRFVRLGTLGLVGSTGRDNDDTLHDYFGGTGNLVAAAEFTNNWSAEIGGGPGRTYEYVLDPSAAVPLDSVFCYSSGSAWLTAYTDQSAPLSFGVSLSGANRSYNYLRHYFAPSAYASAELNWRLLPGLSFGTEVTDNIELDTLYRLAQHNWIVTPEVNWAMTRDLQLRLSSEIVPADTTGRANVLLSWNLSPKSWLYLAWNEQHALTRDLPLQERIGVLKLRYLFYF